MCLQSYSGHGLIREHASRLYRSILRAHRRLPDDMRSLGDVYVKSGGSRSLSSVAWNQRAQRGLLTQLLIHRVPEPPESGQPSAHYWLPITVEDIPGSAASRSVSAVHWTEVGSIALAEGENGIGALFMCACSNDAKLRCLRSKSDSCTNSCTRPRTSGSRYLPQKATPSRAAT